MAKVVIMIILNGNETAIIKCSYSVIFNTMFIEPLKQNSVEFISIHPSHGEAETYSISPVHHRADGERQTTTHDIKLNQHVFVGGATVPGENPLGHRENRQTQALGWNLPTLNSYLN